MKKMTRIGSFLLALVLAISLLPALPVFAATSYGIGICGYLINDTNCADVLGDGVFSYNPSTKTLTVSGDAESDHNILVVTDKQGTPVDGLTVYVAKNSHFRSTGTVIGIRNLNVTFTGPGKLTVTGPSTHSAIFLDGSAELTVKDAKLDVYAGTAIHGSAAKSASVKFINSNVHLKSTYDLDDYIAASIGDLADITLKDCEMPVPADGRIQNGTVWHANGHAAEEVRIVPGDDSQRVITTLHASIAPPVPGKPASSAATVTAKPSHAIFAVDQVV